MNPRAIRRIHRVTALIFCAAVVFYLFFQLNKIEPFRDFNPFGEDPYDAVGSFTIQAALLIGLLTYARALRLRRDSAEVSKTRLILRGNILVLSAILVTLIADAIAEVVHPSPPSYWGNVLLIELAFMFLLTFSCAIGLISVFGRLQTLSPPHDLTPADGIDDLWTLVRVPMMKVGRILPPDSSTGSSVSTVIGFLPEFDGSIRALIRGDLPADWVFWPGSAFLWFNCRRVFRRARRSVCSWRGFSYSASSALLFSDLRSSAAI